MAITVGTRIDLYGVTALLVEGGAARVHADSFASWALKITHMPFA
jgi:hypothetical protein